MFDLQLLLNAGGAERPLPAKAATNLDAAINHALAIDYGAFADSLEALRK